MAHWGAWDTWQHQSSLLGEIKPRAMGHMKAPEPTSVGK
jgi:hypothetical protein